MSTFFAFLNRLKYINRWALMRSTRDENVMEHSAIVSIIAYSLASLANSINGKSLNAERIGMIALLHETSEVITGDMPTPIKYANEPLTTAYKAMEKQAVGKLIGTLSGSLKDDFENLYNATKEEEMYVKYADKISAYLKCKEELGHGNREFASAEKSIKKILDEYNSVEVNYFLENYADAFAHSLDELSESLEN